MRRITLLLALVGSLLLLPVTLRADGAEPSFVPSATLVNTDGEEEELTNGSSYDAPLTLTFAPGVADAEGCTLFYEWRIVQVEGGKETTLAVRNDSVTDYTFREGGDGLSYRVSLAVTWRTADGTEGTWEQDDNDVFRFSLKSSSLQVFNGFSPNGDGINDVYRVKTQSLLSFRMAIFNRWGQPIVSGTDATLEKEYTDGYTYYICWDGTLNGRVVDDGVYFIAIEALGSDGIVYSKHRDINVMTRVVENGDN